MSEEPKAVSPEAAKPAKAPAPETKPFREFIEQDYLPAVDKAMQASGVSDLYLSLVEDTIPAPGSSAKCWQIVGVWNKGMRQFNLYFPNGDINGLKAFSYTNNSGKPSALESFLIDERKATLELMVFGLMQRLNAQKWLTRN
jgi:hypothetical protein